MRIKDGIAEVRAGATLLYDSIPEEEEKETELKARQCSRDPRRRQAQGRLPHQRPELVGAGLKVVLVDHEDSFVHTLANYFRQTGATVTTVRASKGVGLDPRSSTGCSPISCDVAGPGSPSDFHCTRTIEAARDRGLPLFGVCLGCRPWRRRRAATRSARRALSRQAVGDRRRAQTPCSVRRPAERVTNRPLPLDPRGREPAAVGFTVTARTDDGVVMAIEHQSEPMAAVQFHPESIMSLGDDAATRSWRTPSGRWSAPRPRRTGRRPPDRALNASRNRGVSAGRGASLSPVFGCMGPKTERAAMIVRTAVLLAASLFAGTARRRQPTDPRHQRCRQRTDGAKTTLREALRIAARKPGRTASSSIPRSIR